MDMLLRMMVHARPAIKGQIDQAEHVEGGQEGANGSQAIQQIVVMREGMGQDFIFAPEACQGWNARNGDRADQKESISPWDFRTKTAHFSNVLLSRKRMNHRPGRKEQEGFKEGMGHEVKDGRGIGPYSTPEHHVPELAHRRIGQNAFDIRLHEADGGGKQGGEATDDVDDTSKMAWFRTIMYTPAVTIVAAWMSALTGVGPSIASGSHV